MAKAPMRTRTTDDGDGITAVKCTIDIYEDGTVRIQDAAALFGMTYAGVDKWLKAGCPVEYPGGRGKFNGKRIHLKQVLDWHVDREAEMHNQQIDDDLPEGQYSYDRERARREKYQADLAELKARRGREELVEITAIADVVEADQSEIRAGLLNLPGRLAVPLSGISDEAEIAQIVRHEVVDILTRLSSPDDVVKMAISGETAITAEEDGSE